MRLKKKLILFVMIASLLVLSNPSPALATQSAHRAYFMDRAVGECLVAPGWDGGPLPAEWYIGRGTTALGGGVDVAEQPPDDFIPVTYYYADGGVKAGGSVYARWCNHLIYAFLYSKGEAGGLFVDEGAFTDFFVIGIGEAELLLFKGIYKDNAGLHAVSGKAAVMAGISPGPTPIVIIQVVLLTPNDTPFLGMAWVLNDLPLDATTLHAADTFAHYVNIVNLT